MKLDYLSWATLERSRLRADLIQAFKIIKESDGNELNNYFKLAANNLLNVLSLAVILMSVSLPFQTVVDEWNLLEQHVIDSDST